jgi:dCTP deaminase
MTFSLLSDRQIKELCKGDRPMLSPFISTQVKTTDLPSVHLYASVYAYPTRKAISYGVSSYGYDLRLADHDFRIFKDRNIWQKLGWLKTPIIDPKNFDESVLYQAKLHSDESGQYFVMPPHSAALGVSVERFDMPRNVIGLTIGKSTYARCAAIPFTTEVEPEWQGFLTLEFGNYTDFPCKLYANEGILQMAFFQGDDCDVSYSDRNGKYQNQAQSVYTARA